MMRRDGRRGLLDFLLAEAPSEPRARVAAAGAEARDRLRDEGELAQGGMASVHRAFDEKLLRQLAKKSLLEPFASDPLERQRLLEEAQITGQLEHPHIPPVHDHGVDANGRPYIAMKLVQGRTLLDLLRYEGFDIESDAHLDRVMRIFVKVCEAVAFAHARGVVHCDLKPTNIMVGTHGQVYVMDWGIARVVGEARPSGADRDVKAVRLARAPAAAAGKVLGTAAYMAPEQAQGRDRDIDERTDVFALGAVLYRILSGHPPYEARDVSDVVELAADANIFPIEYVTRARLPRRLVEIAMKALARDPADRYASVEALQDDVEAFLRGDGRFPTLAFKAGDVVVEEGAPGDAAYVLVGGRCRVFKTVDGRKETLREMGAGEVFGEAAIFAEQPRMASVVAITDVEVTVVRREALERELGQTLWMKPFVNALAKRFREADERRTQANRERDAAVVGREVMRYLALHGVGDERRKVAPWTPLEALLRDKVRRSNFELLGFVEKIEGVELDLDVDEIALRA